MNTPPVPDHGAQADARQELALILEQTREARVVLDEINEDVKEAQVRLEASQKAPLLEVNQQLVLAMLKLQIASESQTVKASDPAARLDERAGQERRYAHLREANEQLVLAAISAQELQAAAEQAQLRQTRLLAVVAHELRHPLAPIRSAAAVLSRIPNQQPVLVRMQSIIDQQVSHMARLVGDLLDVTRVATGKFRIERLPLDMLAVLDSALRSCKPALDSRMQRLIVSSWPGALPAHGDAMRLTQIFSNILDNASKYTPVGGAVSVSVRVEGQMAVISVTDTGIGITDAALPHVFEPFVQEHHATAFNGEGLGIGLTVVRELAEAHGGSVSASSEGPGLGSCFVVSLPIEIRNA